MYDIVEWESIKNEYTDGLLLGNGASIAVCGDSFKYSALFTEARERKYLSEPIVSIFNDLDKTSDELDDVEDDIKDFELVLRRLWQAKLVNDALGIAANKVNETYQQVRDALIKTIQVIHPSHNDVKQHLKPMYEFMKHFKTVISLNYDLLIYWATQLSRDDGVGNWFKDCFINDVFIDDVNVLRARYRADGVTLFFYPHGNLVLGRTKNGREKKICADQEAWIDLLDTIFKRWTNGSIVPIFVCEGTENKKKQAIESSSYLVRVYHEIMPALGESLVIYGWSMSKQDEHILRGLRLAKSIGLRRVAVSVHGNNQDYVKHVKERLHAHCFKGEIIFFNASSPGCWNNRVIET